MADASSIRSATTLPTATGRNKGSVRLYNNEIWMSDGVSWIPLAARYAKHTVSFTGTLVDQAFFVADRAYTVLAINEVHSTAGTNGSAVNAQVTKDSSTNAPGAGVNLLADNSGAGFDMKATANVVQAGTLVTTTGYTTLAAGDRLSVDFAGTLTALAGVKITVVLQAVDTVAGQTVTVAIPTAGAADQVDQAFFVADRPYQVLSAREVHSVAGDDAGAVTLAITKETSTTAPGGGTAIMSNTFDMKATANTVQSATLSTTASEITLAAGDRLSLNFTGTTDTLAGTVVTVALKAI